MNIFRLTTNHYQVVHIKGVTFLSFYVIYTLAEDGLLEDEFFTCIWVYATNIQVAFDKYSRTLWPTLRVFLVRAKVDWVKRPNIFFRKPKIPCLSQKTSSKASIAMIFQK